MLLNELFDSIAETSDLKQAVDRVGTYIKDSVSSITEVGDISQLGACPVKFLVGTSILSALNSLPIKATNKELAELFPLEFREAICTIEASERIETKWLYHKWEKAKSKPMVGSAFKQARLTANILDFLNPALRGVCKLIASGGKSQLAEQQLQYIRSSSDKTNDLSTYGIALAIHNCQSFTPAAFKGLIDELMLEHRLSVAGRCQEMQDFADRLDILLNMAVLEEHLEIAGLYDSNRDVYRISLDKSKGFWGSVWSGLKYGFERLFHEGFRFSMLREARSLYKRAGQLGFSNEKMNSRNRSLRYALGVPGRVVGAGIVIGQLCIGAAGVVYVAAAIYVIVVVAIILLLLYVCLLAMSGRTPGSLSGLGGGGGGYSKRDEERADTEPGFLFQPPKKYTADGNEYLRINDEKYRILKENTDTQRFHVRREELWQPGDEKVVNRYGEVEDKAWWNDV